MAPSRLLSLASLNRWPAEVFSAALLQETAVSFYKRFSTFDELEGHGFSRAVNDTPSPLSYAFSIP
jgi:hypothetical protein